MVDSEIFSGHYCRACKTSIALYVNAGGPGKCPGCGGPLQAGSGAPKTRTIANFCCASCGTQIGLLVVSGDAKCPGCSAPIK